MELNSNLVEEIFVELLSTIHSTAKTYAGNCTTFRNFTDNEKHLLDVTSELSEEIDPGHRRFYETMNNARKHFCGNDY